MLLTARRRRRQEPPAGIATTLAAGDPIVRVLPGTPDQAAVARRIVDRALGLGHPRRHDVRLAVTELVTNAIRHSRSGQFGGELVLAVVLSRATIRIDVRDQGSKTLPQFTHGEAIGGRGLPLVDRLGDRWGFVREWDRSCTVWVELALDVAPHAARREPPALVGA